MEKDRRQEEEKGERGNPNLFYFIFKKHCNDAYGFPLLSPELETGCRSTTTGWSKMIWFDLNIFNIPDRATYLA